MAKKRLKLRSRKKGTIPEGLRKWMAKNKRKKRPAKTYAKKRHRRKKVRMNPVAFKSTLGEAIRELEQQPGGYIRIKKHSLVSMLRKAHRYI